MKRQHLSDLTQLRCLSLALGLSLTLLLATAAPANAEPAAAAERAPLAPVGVVRELQGQAYSDAVEARDAADRLRAAYEAAHRPGAAKRGGEAGDGAAFAAVVAAYADVVARFPGTEFECGCRLRLAGAYQYRGQFDVTLNEAKQAAERFAGTRPGMDAAHTVALTYLQALHDPAQAAVWFRQLQVAAGGIADEPERLKWQTAAAQGLARCAAEGAAGKK